MMRVEEDGTVLVYTDQDLNPVPVREAVWVKVVQPDGQVIFARPTPTAPGA